MKKTKKLSPEAEYWKRRKSCDGKGCPFSTQCRRFWPESGKGTYGFRNEDGLWECKEFKLNPTGMKRGKRR